MWLQLLCETGFTGFFCIAVFYGYTVICLLPVAMGFGGKEQAEYRGFAQMVVVSLCTWATCEVFGSFYAVELPYYIVLVGAATLKLMPVPVKKPVAKAAPQRSPAPPAPSFAVPQQ